MGFSSQNLTSPQGPVTVFWDIENCQVPSDVCPEDVAGNIRMTLRGHRNFQDVPVASFSAYGDFSAFTKRLREGCQRTGVKLVDVPNGRKDAADKAILVDMFVFALDNPPPSTILLISGDVDFSHAMHILGQRGYTVILVIPSGVPVSSALTKAGRFVWDWPSMARGEGHVPPKTQMSLGASQVARGSCNQSAVSPKQEWRIKERQEETVDINVCNIPECSSEELSDDDKGSVVGLTSESNDQHLNQMSDTMTVEAEGGKNRVYLCNASEKVENSNQVCQEETVDINVNNIPECSCEDLSDADKGSVVGLTSESNDEHLNQSDTVEAEGGKNHFYLCNANEKVENSNQVAVFPEKDERDKGFEEETIDTHVYIISLKCQLVKLLEHSGGCLPLIRITKEYNKFYGRPLCKAEYGAGKLVDLIKKMSDKMRVGGEGEKMYVYLRNGGDRQEKVEDFPAMPAYRKELTTWVQQPGDIISLKGQLVKLLELYGGCLPVNRVAGRYRRTFGRPLRNSEYGVRKLVDLLKMIAGITIKEEGKNMSLHLCNNANDKQEKVENSNPSAASPKIDYTVDIKVCTTPGCSSNEFSGDDKTVIPTSKSNSSLEQFKQEILELLVSCSCKIHLDGLEELYKQRYKKDLYHQSFGVNNLEELIDTLWDDANFYEEQESKRKFLVPNFAKLRFQTF